MKSQKQHFYDSHHETMDTLKDAAFLCGLYGDNPNPLTDTEIAIMANNGKPYSWAFKMILDARKP